MIELNKIYNEDCLEGMKKKSGRKRLVDSDRPSLFVRQYWGRNIHTR